MEFFRRELIGGLSLILALAVFAGSDFRLTPLVIGLLALGGLWTVVVGGHALLQRRKPRETPFSVRLAAELQKGFELRDKARLAKDREELFQASQAFIEWGLRVNELLQKGAPQYFLDLPDRAPWALQGKATVVEIMDARLRGHAELVKQLEGLGK
jgi:hypothetical protein